MDITCAVIYHRRPRQLLLVVTYLSHSNESDMGLAKVIENLSGKNGSSAAV